MSIAEAALARTIKRRVVRSAVIKSSKAFDALYAELEAALTRSWTDAMREATVEALDRLRDLGPGAFTQDDAASILKAMEGRVGEDAMRAALREPVVNLTDGLFRAGAIEVGASVGVDIAFARPDLDAIDILKTGNLYWIGDSWNVRTQNLLAETLNVYFTEGLTREGLAGRMAEDFAGATERSQYYWELLADHTATKTREMGRVTGYQRAEIDRVRVRAQLDNKTSDICKSMHGRVIEVSRLAEQRASYLDAASRRDAPAMKASWAMASQGASTAGTPTSRLARNIGSPPYHFRCRTITVAEFTTVDVPPVATLRQRLVDGETLAQADRDLARDTARGASMMGDKATRKHWSKHRASLPTRRLADYEADARALIDDPQASMRLSTRVPNRNRTTAPGDAALHAVFSKPLVNARTGLPGFLTTAVDLEDGTIVSHHWRDNDSSAADINPGRKLRKGLKTWLSSLFRKI